MVRAGILVTGWRLATRLSVLFDMPDIKKFDIPEEELCKSGILLLQIVQKWVQITHPVYARNRNLSISLPRPKVMSRKMYMCVADSQVYISVKLTTIPQGQTMAAIPAVVL